ncbi:MAG: metallophosphoesterase family protein [Pseudonocardiales bacterium]
MVRTPYGDVPDRLVPDMSMAEMHDYLRRPVSRRGILTAAAAGAASPLLISRVGHADALGPVGSRRLSYGADPTTQMVVSFTVPGPFGSALIEYGFTAPLGSTVPAQDQAAAGSTSRYGTALISGLRPNTQYAYRVRVDNQVSRLGLFRTAPAAEGPFTFTAFADQGITAMAARSVAQIRAVKPAFHLVAGDLCYADSTGLGVAPDPIHPSVWDSWLQLIEPLAAETPWMVAAGNHEMEPGAGENGYGGMLARLAVPDNGADKCPTTYSFRYSNVGFIALDSNDASYEIPANFGYSGLTQRAWLERTLADMRSPDSGVDFIVAYFHHCPYATNGAHGSEGGVREKWVALFDKYEVDLSISGHNHCYERTRAIRSGVATNEATDVVNSKNGTTYLTVGGGGREINKTFLAGATKTRVSYSPRRNRVENADWSVIRSATHSFLVVDVKPARTGTESTMSLRIVSTMNGSVLDHFILQRTSTHAVSDPTPIIPNAGAGGTDATAPLAIGGLALAAAAAAGTVGYRARRHHHGSGW